MQGTTLSLRRGLGVVFDLRAPAELAPRVLSQRRSLFQPAALLLAPITLFASISVNAAATTDLSLIHAVKEQQRSQVADLLSEKQVDVNAVQPDGASALHWAAYWDDLESAELLIRAGARANTVDEQGISPLSLACQNGSAAMVTLLVDSGANVAVPVWTGETPLMTASRTGSADVVKILLAHGAASTVNMKGTSRGQTALMWAAGEGHSAVVAVLLEHAADVNARSMGGFTPLLMAARSGSIDVAARLLTAGANLNAAAPDGSTALYIASASGQYDLAMFLLDRGANPNVAIEGGMTPLHAVVGAGKAEFYAGAATPPDDAAMVAATRAGKIKLISALMSHGASANARLTKPPARVPGQLVDTSGLDLAGATSFLLAAKLAEVQLMRALAAAGADPSIPTNDGTTPLMVAGGVGRVDGAGWQTPVPEHSALEAVALAAELGNDVRATNRAGWTTLHGAAVNGSDTIVRFLVSKGARVDAKDKSGRTAIDIAESFFNGFAVTVHASTAALLRQLARESASR